MKTTERVEPPWRFTRNNGITEGFHTKMEVCSAKHTDFAISITTG